MRREIESTYKMLNEDSTYVLAILPDFYVTILGNSRKKSIIVSSSLHGDEDPWHVVPMKNPRNEEDEEEWAEINQYLWSLYKSLG